VAAALRLPGPADVEAARANIAGYARRTPLWRLDAPAPPGVNIWLKLETLQPTGSFKIRAAVNALKSRDPATLSAGVLGASAGNFGLGLALAARRLGVAVTIVAPQTAADSKAEALRALGATVIRVPFDEWWQVLTTRRFDGAEGVFFHPVAEPEVVAGNATIGAELVEDLPRFDAVVVPFGGGGLISGIGSVVRRLAPGARMLAVESPSSQPAAAALAAGGPVTVPHRPSFVDGIGSTTVLAEMWPLVRETVDGAVTASFDEIAAAIRLLAARHHIIAEGAGAAPVAAALAGRAGEGDIVCVVSGGNLDAAKLSTILGGGTPA
jgi:threonine dehydratase